MQVKGVSGISFEDEALHIGSAAYRYREIDSVSWYAVITQNSINGIPTGKDYDARLSFLTSAGKSITVNPDRGWSGAIKKAGFEGLSRAAEVLSEMTFTNRVFRYEEQLQTRNFFNYGGHQFHESGDVFKGGEYAFNITQTGTQSVLSIFELKVTPERTDKSLFGRFKNRTVLIDLRLDKDCFLYLLKATYGLYFQNETLRKKRRSTRDTFYEAAIRFGALMASSDGNAEARELRTLKEFFSISSEEFPDAAKLYNSQLHYPKSARELLNEFASDFVDASELKETFLFGMGLVAVADGSLHAREAELLAEAASILSIPLKEANRILGSLGVSLGAKQRTHHRPANPEKSPAKYYAVLGVSESATKEEVKIAFRGLARRYHPDVLRSQNLPEEQMRTAELLMKEINDAYEWVKRQ